MSVEVAVVVVEGTTIKERNEKEEKNIIKFLSLAPAWKKMSIKISITNKYLYEKGLRRLWSLSKAKRLEKFNYLHSVTWS